MIDLPNLLRELKYQKVEDFPEKEQQRMKSVLSLDKLFSAVFNITIYARVYETTVDTLVEGTDEKLWSTRITLGSFVLIDPEINEGNGELIDKIIVPLRPFRIRSNHEIVEMNKLYSYIMDDFNYIDTHIEYPPLEPIENYEGSGSNEA